MSAADRLGPLRGSHTRGLELLIIADDLSGAAETAALLADRGVPARLTNRQRVPAHTWEGAVAVSTDSRHMNSRVAHERVRCAVRTQPGLRIFKKIDSTLRGNVGPEVTGLLNALEPGAWLLVCPALPRQGRVVVGGQAALHGLPVSDSAAGADLLAPSRENDVRHVLGPVADAAVTITLDDIARGSGHVAAVVRRGLAGGSRVVLADAVTDEHLDTIVDAGESTDPPATYVGAGGLADAFARRFQGQRRRQLAVRAPLLVVAGSPHPVTREQVRTLRSAVPTTLITLPDLSAADDRAFCEWAAATSDPLRVTDTPLLVLQAPEVSPDAKGATELLEAASMVGDRLARTARALVEAIRVRTLVILGGDTATAVMQRFGLTEQCAVLGEVAPGAAVLAPPAKVESIILRSGGFGPSTGLLDLITSIDKEF